MAATTSMAEGENFTNCFFNEAREVWIRCEECEQGIHDSRKEILINRDSNLKKVRDISGEHCSTIFLLWIGESPEGAFY